MTKNHRAFSIVEMSLVVLIISFLVFGVLAAKNLLINSALAKARSLTSSSSAGGIEDLAFWFETTSEKSFITSEVVNNGLISQWNDINPRLQNKKNVLDNTAGTTNDRPTYIESAINNLPALYFDGASDFLSRANTFGYEFTDGDEMTIFLVQQATTPIQATSTMMWSPGSRINIHCPYSNSNIYWDFGICCGASARLNTTMPANFMNKWNIVSVIRKPDGNGDITVNNTAIATTSSFSSTISLQDSAIFYVGTADSSTGFFKGYIAEIIIYSRALDNNERLQVTNYLSGKWGIDIN